MFNRFGRKQVPAQQVEGILSPVCIRRTNPESDRLKSKSKSNDWTIQHLSLNFDVLVIYSILHLKNIMVKVPTSGLYLQFPCFSPSIEHGSGSTALSLQAQDFTVAADQQTAIFIDFLFWYC